VGTVRTLLALAVVFAHCYGFMFTGGMLAVQIFYMISGYLMSLILLNENAYTNLKSFYINRALRLFPIYWIVAAASLLLSFYFYFIGLDNFFYIYKEVDLWGSILLFISNFTLLGQDWLMFTGIIDGQYGFISNLYDSEMPIDDGLLVPQAWTLGLEISFYIIAPFILRHKKRWLTLLILSLGCKFWLIYYGVGTTDPFSYRFFPAELSLFLLGVFAHQFLLPAYQKNNLIKNNLLVTFITLLTILIVLFYSLIFSQSFYYAGLMIMYILMVIPFLASFQQQSKIDNWIGNLSYPIYICHMLVISIFDYLGKQYNFFQTQEYYIAIFSLTIFISIMLEIFINRKVNLMRSKFRGR
jgi:peptidoglycan/LPS O-acetylase OafA/YrhL